MISRLNSEKQNNAAAQQRSLPVGPGTTVLLLVLVYLCGLITGAYVVANQALAADLGGPLLEQVSYPPTSSNEVESSNPIQLRIVKEAPSSDLPEITGPLGLSDAVKIGIKNNLTLKQFEQSWISSKFLARSALAKFGPSASFNTLYSTSALNQMLFSPVTPLLPLRQCNRL